MICNKNNFITLCSVSIALILSIASYAQSKDFSGVWALKHRENLSGPGYINGVPKQMMISLKSDSMMIERVYEGETNSDYSIIDALALNGKPTVALRSNNKRQSVLKAGINKNAFSVGVTYRDVNTGNQTSADFVESWNLTSSGKELIIEKKAKEPDGNTWSMKGIYELKTVNQRATDAAKGNGIQFVEGLSWEQVKALAKKENKFIFVDCYATWCMPCKKMEKEIFPLNIVGDEMNSKFISLRVQMDTTKRDNDYVRSLYPFAHQFLKEYNLTGYPTYLFFDSNGNIIHKDLGMYESDDFLKMTEAALDPNKQFYTLLANYKVGKMDFLTMDYLALTAVRIGEEKVAEDVIRSYKNGFLDKLPIDSLLTKKYLSLVNQFASVLIYADGSKSNFFSLLYQRGKDVDRLLNAKGFSSFFLNNIITREEINGKIYNSNKLLPRPEWNKITETIKEKYKNVDAELLILNAQIEYYGKLKEWDTQINYFVKKVDKYGPLSIGNSDGSGSDNAIANIILPHCDIKQILNKAVGWMEKIIHSNAYKYPVAMVYGNYGGILYKAGRYKEGIDRFEKHLNAIGYKNAADIDKDPRFKPKVEMLHKMKRREKIDSTWNITAFF